jgi:GNAT superfamily N-acetyltransferase
MSEIENRIIFRTAQIEDLPQIIKLIADIVVSKDPLKYADEVISDPPLNDYVEAFKEILCAPNDAIVGVLEDEIVAYTQISYLPGLTHHGKRRAIIEDVRISRKYRGANLGRLLMANAIERAKQKACWVIQLTTNKWREDAILFYEKLGFQRSHEGFRIQF